MNQLQTVPAIQFVVRGRCCDSAFPLSRKVTRNRMSPIVRRRAPNEA
jgi:hypothetical protein